MKTIEPKIVRPGAMGVAHETAVGVSTAGPAFGVPSCHLQPHGELGRRLVLRQVHQAGVSELLS
jgi:hypothetical protein